MQFAVLLQQSPMPCNEELIAEITHCLPLLLYSVLGYLLLLELEVSSFIFFSVLGLEPKGSHACWQMFTTELHTVS